MQPVKSLTRAQDSVLGCMTWMRGDTIRDREIAGWSENARVVTNVAAQEHKRGRIVSCSSKAAKMSDSMPRAIEKVKRPIAEVVKGGKLANSR